MRTTWVIARNTIQEAIRRKILNIILIFGMVSIGASKFFSYLSPGEENKFIMDFSMGSILFFGMLISIFLGASLIPDEIERKTIFTILSKPVDRLEFIMGKFIGTIITVFLNTLLMGLTFLIVYFVKQHTIQPNAIKAIVLIFFELMVLSSLTIALSVIFSSSFNIVFSFFLYFIGQASGSFEHLQEHADSPVVASVLKVTYLIVPHLDDFDVRQALIMDNPVTAFYMGKVILYAFMYMAVAVLLGYLFFYDREF